MKCNKKGPKQEKIPPTPGFELQVTRYLVGATLSSPPGGMDGSGAAFQIFSTLIYHAPGTAPAAIPFSMFSWKAAAGLIKPETLPPTEGATAQHSLRAYLQTRDWILLQSMPMGPSAYGWKLGG